MATSRKDQLQFCQVCLKKDFDKGKGIVCSLTGEHASFLVSCPDFEKDPLSVKRHERIEKQKEEMSSSQGALSESVQTSERKMFSAGIIGGILLIIAGVGWFIGGMAVNRIFFYPFFLVIAGVVSLVKGLAKKADEMQGPDTSEILDDKNDLEVL